MATTDGRTDRPLAWKPGSHGIWSSRQITDGEPSAISLRHPMSPFVGPVNISGQSFDQESLQNLGHEYLTALKQLGMIDPLPQQWLDALQPGSDDPTFGWMPVGWPPKDESDGDAANPFVSFRLERNTTAGAEPDLTVVLLASERLSGKFIGSGFGISMVANLRSSQGRLNAQFVGMSASFDSLRVKSLGNTDWNEARIKPAELLALLNSEDVKREISSILDLSLISIRGARLSGIDGEDEWQVERRGTGRGRSSSGAAIDYSFVVVGTPRKAGKVVSRVALQAAAAGDARVFPIDPASQGASAGYRDRRPSRSDQELDGYRTDTQLPAFPVPLVLKAGGRELMRVINCPGFVLADVGTVKGSAKSVELPGGTPLVHSDDLSAVSAFYNVSQIFERLAAYGLDPFTYFRFASLPLKLAYRSGMQAGPGKDGHTINACVEVDGWPVDFTGPTPVGQRPTMEIHLALADKSRRGRKPWDRVQRSPAEPLGIAADDRWIWHEIGHVLLVAAVGELEFRFAHSAGDALAAIAMDPDSSLCDLGDIPHWRGMNFPRVFTPRRHDRCVTDGWSWGGTMHSALARVPNSTPPRRKGYLSEQILSSSLFRLYRVLGGDTTEATPVDVDTRHAASHYCVFLIMRAIQLLGTQSAVLPQNDPDQFVKGLIDADIGTSHWSVTLPDGQNYERSGGCAQKVIRWAFEAQGLYAPAGTLTNAPGLPPAVDIYIANGRRSETTESRAIAYGPGNYAPVSLHWDPNQTGADPLPAWQADPGAITVEANGIYVVVGNRGTEVNVAGVQVIVWWIEWRQAEPPPAWNTPGWTQCPQIGSQNISPATEYLTFGPFDFAPPASRRYIVLAKATCADDPANIDVPTFACSYLKTRLVDLVAGDNNIGLRVVTLA
jgi:hypothetical protein